MKNDKKPSSAILDSQKTLHKNLQFTATEQYKLLRTNISFAIPDETKCSIIGVTSAIRGEGKSTTAINLAYVLSEDGKKVLLIDGDMRIPSVAKKLEIKSTPGLTDCLRKPELLEESIVKSTESANWYILPAGTQPPNPSELLGSERMEAMLTTLAKTFDFIIIDLPPVNIVSDALVVSKYITGMVVVVREGYTEKSDVRNCFRQLELSNVTVFGCVMNGANAGNGGYRYRSRKYYKYYRNNYGYGYGYGYGYARKPSKPSAPTEEK